MRLAWKVEKDRIARSPAKKHLHQPYMTFWAILMQTDTGQEFLCVKGTYFPSSDKPEEKDNCPISLPFYYAGHRRMPTIKLSEELMGELLLKTRAKWEEVFALEGASLYEDFKSQQLHRPS